MWKKDMTAIEAAEIIERFLRGHSLYPQEWNDFVDTPQHNKQVEIYRKRCNDLDPLVNEPGDMNPAAVADLRSMVDELRKSGQVPPPRESK